MVVFSEVEISVGLYLGGNVTKPATAQNRLIGVPRHKGLVELLVSCGINGLSVLGTKIISLAHTLSRVVSFPKGLKQCSQTR